MNNSKSTNTEYDFFRAINIDSFPKYRIEGITQRRILNGEINHFVPIEIKFIPHYKDPENRVNIIVTTILGDEVISRYERKSDQIVQDLISVSQELAIEKSQNKIKNRFIYTNVNDGKWIHFTKIK